MIEVSEGCNFSSIPTCLCCRQRIKEALKQAGSDERGPLMPPPAISLLERSNTIRALGLPQPAPTLEDVLSTVEEEGYSPPAPQVTPSDPTPSSSNLQPLQSAAPHSDSRSTPLVLASFRL